MVYVTHDQVEAMTLASRIVVLHGGDIEQVGAPLELYERPQNVFVARFIGSPAMNILGGKVSTSGAETVVKMDQGGNITVPIASVAGDKGQAVQVGVRPEDFVATEDGGIYTGKVDFTEALGEVTILYFEAEDGKEPVLAKMAGIHPGLRGQTVTVGASPEKVQIFADGKSLYYR